MGFFSNTRAQTLPLHSLLPAASDIPVHLNLPRMLNLTCLRLQVAQLSRSSATIFNDEFEHDVETGEPRLSKQAPFARQPALQQYIWYMTLVMHLNFLRCSTVGEHVSLPLHLPVRARAPSPSLLLSVPEGQQSPNADQRQELRGGSSEVCLLRRAQVEVPEGELLQTTGALPRPSLLSLAPPYLQTMLLTPSEITCV